MRRIIPDHRGVSVQSNHPRALVETLKGTIPASEFRATRASECFWSTGITDLLPHGIDNRVINFHLALYTSVRHNSGGHMLLLLILSEHWSCGESRLQVIIRARRSAPRGGDVHQENFSFRPVHQNYSGERGTRNSLGGLMTSCFSVCRRHVNQVNRNQVCSQAVIV